MLNTLLSATATVLFVLLCVIYPLGILRFSEKSKEKQRKSVDCFLRKIHKKNGSMDNRSLAASRNCRNQSRKFGWNVQWKNLFSTSDLIMVELWIETGS